MVLLVNRASNTLCVNVHLAALVCSVKQVSNITSSCLCQHSSFRSVECASNPCMNGATCEEGFKQFCVNVHLATLVCSVKQVSNISGSCLC